MQPTLIDTERLINKNQESIHALRQQAQTHRDRADEFHRIGDAEKAQAEEAQALGFEQGVADLEFAFAPLVAQKRKLEQQIATKTREKEKLTQEYRDQVNRIDDEIARLRG